VLSVDGQEMSQTLRINGDASASPFGRSGEEDE
jgi:hypothetical protein